MPLAVEKILESISTTISVCNTALQDIYNNSTANANRNKMCEILINYKYIYRVLINIVDVMKEITEFEEDDE